VPNVILSKKKNAENKNVVSCSVLWIEPIAEKINHSDQLRKLITEKEWSQMNIFYFLFGQYDRHFGNVVVSKDTGKLYLIDNEAVANIDQMVLGYSPDKKISCPWVPIAQSKDAVIEGEPAELMDVLKAPQDPAMIHKLFPGLDQWTKRDIDNDFCRVWHSILWRQMYAGSSNLAAPCAEIISPELLKKIENLTAQDIAALWPALPCDAHAPVAEEYQQFIKTFVDKTFMRRDMITNYFKLHPEGIREYK
jgi:hypothetical protein